MYLVPVGMGYEPFLDRTWTTALITFGLMLIAIGVSRLRFVRFERHVAVIYQWAFLSLLFISMDVGLIYFTNLNVGNSTAIVLATILFVYFPIRQLLHSRLTNAHQRNYQGLFSHASEKLVASSLHQDAKPRLVWLETLEEIFQPTSSEVVGDSKADYLSDRGQSLVVAQNYFSNGIKLNYADAGSRLFDEKDVDLVNSLAQLFVRLFQYRDGVATGQLLERERIRRDLHDQIGSNLLSMIYSAKDKDSRELATETLSQLRELLKAIKHEPIKIPMLVAELRSVCEESCNSVGLMLEWQDNISDEDRLIPSFHYSFILSIFRELINNTARHAKASNLKIVVSANDDGLTLHYEDDGKGFDMNLIVRGNGLNNIHSRVEEMNADLRWSTRSGTSALFSIPIARQAEK